MKILRLTTGLSEIMVVVLPDPKLSEDMKLRVLGVRKSKIQRALKMRGAKK
jgi:hypothetical protein